MNKIIFQIGMLGFCLSVVLFGMGSVSIIIAIVQAFIVSMAIMILGLTILAVARIFGSEGTAQNPEPGIDTASARGVGNVDRREKRAEDRAEISYNRKDTATSARTPAVEAQSE